MSTRIFIVEDERIVAEDIRMTLESFGYAVAGIAASRDQALAEIRRTSPDLVLMDIVLKGPGDGVETARLVREQFDIPAVFLTAHADNATLHRAKVTEPFGYILKPFEGHELYSGVEIALYRHQVEKRIDAHERWLATILASIGDGGIAAGAQRRQHHPGGAKHCAHQRWVEGRERKRGGVPVTPERHNRHRRESGVP